jgi:hypothetical protein
MSADAKIWQDDDALGVPRLSRRQCWATRLHLLASADCAQTTEPYCYLSRAGSQLTAFCKIRFSPEALPEMWPVHSGHAQGRSASASQLTMVRRES